MAKNTSVSLGQHFEQWLKDNAKAIEAYNEKVEASGTFSDSVRKF
ncbi:MAG: hypothetical protein CMF22_08850 [Idiomarinaceae bacterium]|nr:hypothetical protein [Idiomarinaceae bacterium]|tara:strand:+ start:860 stop:994 length:135 start_codon:yes stop_codon:yes gene_type:complete